MTRSLLPSFAGLAVRLLVVAGVAPAAAWAQDTGFVFDDLPDDAGEPAPPPAEPDPYADPYAPDPADSTDVPAAAIDIPAAGASMDFDINSVLVATFEAGQTFLEPEAERVKALVEDALSDGFVVVRMADVPPFTDYDADVYLRSCPKGQYIGCVFVVGGRAQSDWTIGGRITAVDGGYRVDMSFIDVSDAKLVLEIDVTLDGSNDVEFKEGVLQVMDALVSGQVQSLDLRGDPAAARAAQEAEARRQREARDFAANSLYEDTEDMGRGDVGLDRYVGDEEPSGRGGKVSMSDLDAMEDAGGLTPWERAGLNKSQYRMYRNRGMSLRDFKERLRGRKGQVLLRVAGTVGAGPFQQEHDTFLALDPSASPDDFGQDAILDEFVVLRQGRALGFGGQFELAFGATPWLDIGVFFGLRSAPYQSRFFVQQAGTEAPGVPDPDGKAVTTWNAGARIGVAPGPAWPARPTVHVGASYWAGSRLSRVVQNVPAFLSALQTRPNNMILVHIQPGIEVDAGKLVQIWARADIDLPVAGRTLQRFRTDGGDALQTLPNTTTNTGLGVGGTLGLTFRVRVGP